MKRISCIIFSIIACSFIVVAVGCDNGSYVCEETAAGLSAQSWLIGVWQTADFEKVARDFESVRRDPIAVYITEEHDLYVMFASTVFRYQYTIIENELALTAVPNPAREEYEKLLNLLSIEIEDNAIYLSADGLSGDIPRQGWGRAIHIYFEQLPVVLYRESHEVPFGWTDIDRQKIAETRQNIKDDILAHAEKFGETLGLSIEETHHGIGRQSDMEHSLDFAIDDYRIMISIAFIGVPPAPTRAQRYSSVPLDSTPHLVNYFRGVSNSQFQLLYNPFDNNQPTEEMLEIFMSLLDS